MRYKTKIFILTMLLLVFQDSFASESSVDLKVAIDKITAKSVRVNIALINNTDKAACLNASILGADGSFYGDLFNITRVGSNEHVAYYGTQSDSVNRDRRGIAILPGRSVTVNLDLATLYDLSKPGEYVMSYHALMIAECARFTSGFEFAPKPIHFVIP